MGESIRKPAGYIKDFMQQVFIGLGVPVADAEICADVLVAADLRGIDSHGINRLKPIYYDRIKAGIQYPNAPIDIVREGPTTAVLDANNGMGMVVSHKAMAMAVEKAKKLGLGMTVVRNSTHYGIAGYYPLMAVEQGCIGLSGTNARPSIAPTFGVENMLGTNPQTWAMPTDEEFPFFLDCATSVSQRGKIEVYARTGKTMPEGWVVRRDGSTATDPNQVLKDLIAGEAALTPLGGIGEDGGGYKGYGYAVVTEVLSAALQGGQFLKALSGFDEAGERRPYRLGHFFLAIDIEAFTELEIFKKSIGDILRSLRASDKAPGQERIYTAGEKEWEAYRVRSVEGIEIPASVAQEFRTMADELGISGFDW
ncbi:Ldh family oxidoreductase [Spirochaeta africana]|uniref:Malate/lactate dehydrogenase n=1 Tax=Spirochaeta africana (strain ATCC 700263 / DSM 8902 / Z-7692) TaxID=889378 RepID=H9UMY7_SPIAZ|nr:Ldh family oxidoreductase [Spirochaeta africana]AFG38880.1 malate/lactate dehydrogenase [Spirochaeta africana DSM 8902]